MCQKLKYTKNTPFSIISLQFSYIELTLIIPNKVTNIGDGAFANNSISSLTIPSSVISIGEMAFEMNNLSAVTIPNSVTSIGGGAFNVNAITEINSNSTNGIIYSRNSDGSEDKTKIVSYCGVAKNIDFIPNYVITLAKYSFFRTPISSVIIPNNVTTIGNYAFGSCTLTSINIPGNVNTIGEGAFSNNSLTEVTIPNNMISIGIYAFIGNKFTSFTLPVHPTFNSYGWIDDNNALHNGGENISNLFTGYAIPGAYPISYVLNGGINSANNSNAYHKDAGVTSFIDATRPGYTFMGWYNANNEKVTAIATGTEANMVLIAQWDVASGVDEATTPRITLFPNPATSFITINHAEGQMLSIYSMSGTLLMQTPIDCDAKTINVNHLSLGTYIVKVGVNTTLLIRK